EVTEAVNQIEDVSVLKQLHRQAIAISSMVEFQKLLSQNQADS
ncbi:MAG: transposase, partial [Symploca sp. SIO1B1]|nr:transposase [Symploca sp. SIO1B1]